MSSIPILPASPGALGPKETLAPLSTPSASFPRILAVDDDADIRNLILKRLTHSGYRVDTAEDGETGWNMLHQGRYDLLITDNKMPKLSGIDLIKKARSARLALPVILASGSLPVEANALQPVSILAKPFTMDLLLQTVQEVLHRPTDIARGNDRSLQL